jgi:hypothetical protein
VSVNKVLYLIGSLRNSRILELGNMLRVNYPDIEVFNDWYAAGPEADDFWKEYEQSRGRTYQEALAGHAAKNVFAFDKRHLDRCTHALLVLPAGKSGHMEVMYATYGVGAKTAILLDPDDVRWDVMYQFVPTILNNDGEISEWLNTSQSSSSGSRPSSLRASSPVMSTPVISDGPQQRPSQWASRKASSGRSSQVTQQRLPL